MRSLWRHLLRHHNHHSKHPTLLSPEKPTSKITSFHRLLPSSATISSISASNASPSSSSSSWPDSMNALVGMFSGPSSVAVRDSSKELADKVSILKSELLKHENDFERVHEVLDESGSALFSRYADGAAMIELLQQLSRSPLLAVEVFHWRRKHADFTCPISSEEYAKGIRAAGRAKDIDLAVELFTEALNNRCKTTSTYNALMGAFMVNGLAEKCQWLFRDLKKEETCRPNIVTYNTLINVFGRLILVDHMEATLKEVYDSFLKPDLHTFDNLIAGYVTAWMWDRMERTYEIMKESSVELRASTYKLMVRGYAHAVNIIKMEEMYELLQHHSKEEDISLIKAMISAYSKSSCANKIEKIDALMKTIPEWEYRSWLIVTLIRVYAQEQLLDEMEDAINIAFKNNVIVIAADVMRSVITAYYRHNAVDKLSNFVKRAECRGWKICRSLYHCKMVLYSSEGRLEEMENVLEEMEYFNIDSRSKKTLAILSTAYATYGPQCKLEQVIALMLKLGYAPHWDKVPCQ